MRIFLTGGCGFIGSAVIRRAVAATGHEIINIDKMTYAASEDALESAGTDPRHRLVKADITDAAAMRDCFSRYQPDAVMHLAAESHVDRSIDGPAAFVHTNVVGTFTLLEAARDYYGALSPEARGKFRFHHISTDEVFGALSDGVPAFKETIPTGCRSSFPTPPIITGRGSSPKN